MAVAIGIMCAVHAAVLRAGGRRAVHLHGRRRARLRRTAARRRAAGGAHRLLH